MYVQPDRQTERQDRQDSQASKDTDTDTNTDTQTQTDRHAQTDTDIHRHRHRQRHTGHRQSPVSGVAVSAWCLLCACP